MRNLSIDIKEINNGFIVNANTNSHLLGETYCEDDRALQAHIEKLVQDFADKEVE